LIGIDCSNQGNRLEAVLAQGLTSPGRSPEGNSPCAGVVAQVIISKQEMGSAVEQIAIRLNMAFAGELDLGIPAAKRLCQSS
jgi:hypothetical protein